MTFHVDLTAKHVRTTATSCLRYNQLWPTRLHPPSRSWTPLLDINISSTASYRSDLPPSLLRSCHLGYAEDLNNLPMIPTGAIIEFLQIKARATTVGDHQHHHLAMRLYRMIMRREEVDTTRSLASGLLPLLQEVEGKAIPPSLWSRAQRRSVSFRFAVVGAPSEQLALTNCLIVHPRDFSAGQVVLVKRQFPLTCRSVLQFRVKDYFRH